MLASKRWLALEIGLGVDVLLKGLLDLLDLPVQILHMLRQIGHHQRRAHPRLQPVGFLLAQNLQVFQMSHQGLQIPEMGGRRRPTQRALAGAELGDQERIGFIGLVAAQLALSEGFDASRVHYTYRISLLM